MIIFKTIIEVIIVILIGYCIWHEEDLVELEDAIWQWVKRGFKRG